MSTNKLATKGLEDIVAASSSICFIDGKEGRLIYRGYDIKDLAEYSSFEETVYLLWFGNLPTVNELEEFSNRLMANRKLPKIVNQLIHSSKNAEPSDVLRTSVSALQLHDADSTDNEYEANLRKATRLVSQAATIIAQHERVRKGLKLIEPSPNMKHAGNFLYMLTGKEPSERDQEIFDVCLILHADHELNASTFVARSTVSTLSDMHSAVTSAVGTLKGPLHGGANIGVMKMLRNIPDPSGSESYVRKALEEKKKIMGFGHRVYRTEDPRAAILRKFSEELGKRSGDTRWYETTRRVEEAVKKEKGLYPNVDLYSASVYHYLGISQELFTPIFALSRIGGWTAHILEQYSDNRLIRPVAQYIGPKERRYTPADKR
ncbi:MAG: citrate synthase [Thaumarchaeota archaeon]|nr:citrate synthase [Nitrososphaerota archaeon]